MKKKTVAGQVFGIFLTHTLVSLMMLFIFMGIVSLWENSVLTAVLAAVGAAAYAWIVFTKAYECAVYDLKSYSSLKPYATKGVLLASFTVGLVIALWIFHGVLWRVSPITEESFSFSTVGVNALYLLMTSPFFHIIDIKGADCNIWGQIISVIVPFAAIVAGYYAGFKKWDYVKFFNKFVYESKRK